MNSRRTGIIAYLILFFVVWSVDAQAQYRAAAEAEYEQILERLKIKQRSLDSLSEVYTGRVEKLEALKKSNFRDEQKILDLTSSSIAMSNEIGALRSEIRKINEKLLPVKDRLKEEYNGIVVQLQKERKVAQSAEKTALIDEQLLFFLTRKIALASPELKFTFDPGRLASSDITRVSNPAQRNLYRERFQSAYDEVERLLSSVDEASGELQRIVKLQKKSKQFLEEREFAGSVDMQSGGGGSNRDKSGLFTSGGMADVTTRIAGNMAAYQNMLSQLSFIPEVNTFMRDNKNPAVKGKHVEVQAYLATLKELRNGLQEFKQLVGEKLEALQ